MARQWPKFSQILTRIRTDKRVWLGLVACLILFFGALGTKMYLNHRAASIEFMLTRFNAAITARDTPTLAQLIDFEPLSEDFISKMEPFLPTRPDEKQRQQLKDSVQKRLLAVFTTREEAAKETPPPPPGTVPTTPMDDPIFDILKKPIDILPPNFLTQIQERPFTLHAATPTLAVLNTTVNHPQLKEDFVLRLGVTNGPQGWQITQVANADQIVDQYVSQLEAARTKAIAAFDAENARIRTLIGTYYYVMGCTVAIFPPDPSNVVRLRINVEGVNMGTQDLVTSAVHCVLRNTAGKQLSTMRLENTRRVPSGDSFEHSWLFNFETRRAEVDDLLSAGPLTCTAYPVTATLGKGRMLFPRDWRELPGMRMSQPAREPDKRAPAQ